ncbi:hypothetical protein RJ55_04426 [Drechmeria coniospora]|nr:hypothetical protein RJ55_04426 [Drechmeria coniospora]
MTDRQGTLEACPPAKRRHEAAPTPMPSDACSFGREGGHRPDAACFVVCRIQWPHPRFSLTSAAEQATRAPDQAVSGQARRASQSENSLFHRGPAHCLCVSDFETSRCWWRLLFTTHEMQPANDRGCDDGAALPAGWAVSTER